MILGSQLADPTYPDHPLCFISALLILLEPYYASIFTNLTWIFMKLKT